MAPACRKHPGGVHASNSSRWKFSISVLLPVIAAVILTLGLAAGFVVWSAGRVDTRALERQQALAAKMIETAKSDFATSQTDQALRYDIVDVFLAKKPDHDDIDGYLGADEYGTTATIRCSSSTPR